jgi:uncharacterized LabA/DUF88 family protein
MTSTVTHTMRPDRVAVFIDYGNAHRGALSIFHPFGTPTSDGQLDPVALAQLLTSRRNRPSELTQVRIYRGEPSDHRQPGAAIANSRQRARWRRDPRVQVHSRPLAYSLDPDRPPQEKGIDASLAIDLAMADGHAFDVAIVFSCDRDVHPGIEAARRRRAVHVEVAAWAGTGRLHLPDGARLWCHHLAEPDYRAVADHRRYLRT